MGDDISRQQGNWSQLRQLVLRLLQAHEETIDNHEGRISSGQTVDAQLQKDIDRCLEEIFGDASTDSLRTAIRLVQAEQAGMHKAIEGAHAKANAAHAKANVNSTKIASLKVKKTPDGKGKASNKMVIALISVVSLLVNIIWEMLKQSV